MSANKKTAEPGLIIDIDQFTKSAAAFSLRLANQRELAEGIAVAEELMGEKIASPSAVSRMHEITGMTAWVTGHPVEGIFLMLPLSASGEIAVRDGSYIPANPDPDHLCRPGDICSAMYVGVYAGRTHEARKAVMSTAAVLRVEECGSIPVFARGATEDGRRSMDSLGLVPWIGGLPDLYVQEALTPAGVQAA